MAAVVTSGLQAVFKRLVVIASTLSAEPFITVQPPCDEKFNYIMDDLFKEHAWGSIDSDSSDDDCGNVPNLVCDSSATSGDDGRSALRPIARKKKVICQLSSGEDVLILSSGDDNESMGKLFSANILASMSELAKSNSETNSYAVSLAECVAELKMAALRVCTDYAKCFDESSACNAEPRIEHLMERLGLATGDDAATYVANAFDAKKASYTALQWQDMAAQRAAWLKKTRPRGAITFMHKCCNVADLLTKDQDPATKHAILSMVKAPPTTIGMGRPVALTGLEILWRLHVVLGHASIDQVMATLSKTEGMRAGVVTKADVEAFVRLGCAQCIVWKMRRAPVKSLIDPTLAPPGKKWSYDTLTLKVKTAAGNLYITRFLDNGSGKKRSYGHKDFTASTLEMLLSLMRAWVRPVHGEIWIGRRDGHPSQRAKSFQDALSEAQIHDESTAPYQHESMPVENTWQHDVPGAMILLSTGPGAKALRHFGQAFLTHEDASNRVVKPRAHGGEAKSADMIYFHEPIARANLL